MNREFVSTYALDYIIWDRTTGYAGEPEEDETSADAIGLEESSSHPDIGESAESEAESMVALGYAADFSVESLVELDRCFVEKVHAETPGYKDIFADDLAGRCFAMGAYLGEVLRRNGGGEWYGDPADPMIHINLEVKFSDGSIARPMKQILTRLNTGPDVSFVSYAQEFGVADGVSKGSCQVRASSPDFPIRGHVTLWHYPASTAEGTNYHFTADASASVDLLAYLSFLESSTSPTIKSITTVTEEYGVVLPEEEGHPGKMLHQLVLFFDPALDPDHWKFDVVPEGLYLEFGTHGLSSFKKGVDQMYTGTGTPVIGTKDTFLHIWPKSGEA
jgi:hypothetical protein